MISDADPLGWERECAQRALASVHTPQLLVGGTADPVWRRDAIAANPALEVFELVDVDHALQVPGDPSASLDALRLLTDAIGRFVAAL